MFKFLFGGKNKKKKYAKKEVRKRKNRTMRFGNSMPGVFNTNSDYGYNQDVKQTPSVVPQSPNYVTAQSNVTRPTNLTVGGSRRDMQLQKEYIPTYGTGARFFNSMVPRVVGPSWNSLGQQDGSSLPVGWPFYSYGTPSNGFGKRRRKSRKVKKTRKVKKIPKKIIRLCKKLKIKTTVKRGSKRVYKKLSVLKKQIKMKMKKRVR